RIADDLGVDAQQIGPGHPGLAGRAGRNGHNVGACQGRIVVAPLDAGIKTFDGTCLGQVQSLALGHVRYNIDKYDVPQFLGGKPMAEGGTGHAGADDGNLLALHGLSLPELPLELNLSKDRSSRWIRWDK